MKNYWQELTLTPSNKIKPIKQKESIFRDEYSGARYTGFVGVRSSLDAENFIKVFPKHIHVLASLSSAGMKVFFMILDIIEDKKETIFINLDKRAWEDYTAKMDEMGVDIGLNINTFYRGVRDLLKRDVIRKARRDGEYQINPSIIFNGKRDKALKKEIKE